MQHKAERAEDMVNTLRRGLDCLPFSEPLRRWVVKAHLDAGDLRAAIEEMQNLALTIAPTIPDKRPGAPSQINPDWIQIHFRLAEYYEALDEPERALDQYSIALKKDPTGPFAKEIQAQIERLKAKIVAENAP
ncbi:MAG: hypothetical protein BWZ10_02818 [candidate division BRC1 bacterium ADurb.BinA364]|nr:MAG: hypothetical protein BWZ10_02818 [candidate division BRC1 bacterium ADurb.BinA364]